MSEQYDKLNYWYGWNGGECPVHPETYISVMYRCGKADQGYAKNEDWDQDRYSPHDRDIIAFCILTLYREPKKPREWWIADFGTDSQSWLAYGSREAVNEGALVGSAKIIHVREVLPEDEA
jgi:hypothetical protein